MVSGQHRKEPVRKGPPGVVFPGRHLACGQSLTAESTVVQLPLRSSWHWPENIGKHRSGSLEICVCDFTVVGINLEGNTPLFFIPRRRGRRAGKWRESLGPKPGGPEFKGPSLAHSLPALRISLLLLANVEEREVHGRRRANTQGGGLGAGSATIC